MSNTWQAAACASVNAAQKQGFAPRCCVCCVLDLGLFPIQRRGYAAVEMGKTLGRPVVRFHLAPHAQKRLTVSAGAPRASAGSAADEIYDLASRRAGPADFFVEVISSATSRSGGVPQRRRYAPGAEAADVHDASTSFVFIDVSPDMVARELRAWWPKLRSGGMMAGLGEGGAREAAEAFAGAAAEDCWLRLHREAWILHRPISIDAAYCISLPSHRERRLAMEAQFRAAGLTVEFFDAIDGTRLPHPRVLSDGQAGCLASHLAVMAKAKAAGATNVLVFEDDVRLASDFLPKLRGALARCPASYDVLYVGSVCVSRWGHYLHRFDEPLARAGRVGGCHAYVVNTEIQLRLAAELGPMRQWFADHLTKRVQPERRCYVCVPALAATAQPPEIRENFDEYVYR